MKYNLKRTGEEIEYSLKITEEIDEIKPFENIKEQIEQIKQRIGGGNNG